MATWTESVVDSPATALVAGSSPDIALSKEQFYFGAPTVTRDNLSISGTSRAITLGNFTYNWGIPRDVDEVVLPSRNKRIYYWHN